jgi:hypothetical protein
MQGGGLVDVEYGSETDGIGNDRSKEYDGLRTSRDGRWIEHNTHQSVHQPVVRCYHKEVYAPLSNLYLRLDQFTS